MIEYDGETGNVPVIAYNSSVKFLKPIDCEVGPCKVNNECYFGTYCYHIEVKSGGKYAI